MTFKRSGGILLHPTSLPGPYGIGDIGPEAFEWIDYLSSAGCSLWQVLPLGPTGYGDSPYQCFSSFAGNPYLISPDLLLKDGLLHPEDVNALAHFPAGRVDYGAVIPFKVDLLTKAYARFHRQSQPTIKKEFDDFRLAQAHWLDDFALFMAIKETQSSRPWVDWPTELRTRQSIALEAFHKDHVETIERQAFWQYLFFKQWAQLRQHAADRDIRIIGDIPIFVAHDSADVWSHPELFHLDPDGRPTVVAGVPPDYFSTTGQLWGNPLYDWENHAKDGYRWWLDRLDAVLALVDIVRLDHFRGFAGYWEIPASEETAINGEWKPGPGASFFEAVESALGHLPIIAEDLGEITPDVIELRDQFKLPGMKILVFAFDSNAENEFLPHNFPPNCVVYTGTHDNDTSVGWYERTEEEIRHHARQYLAQNGLDIAWDLIRAAWSSVAVFALAPMQDFLNLDYQARMNYPSTASGNWSWRMESHHMADFLQERIKTINSLYGRLSKKKENVSAS
jgi:4-alpha-glucanotransferase